MSQADLLKEASAPGSAPPAVASASILIAGIGGIGFELFKKVITVGRFARKPVKHVVVVDFFKDDAAVAVSASKLRELATSATKKLAGGGASEPPKIDVLRWNAAVFASTEAVCAKLKDDSSLPRIYDAVIVTTGLGYHGNLAEVPLADTNAAFQRLMQVNCTGPALLMTFVATHLMTKKSDVRPNQTPPVFLIMSSYSGLVGLPDRAAYCASKFALNGFAESLYADMRHLRLVMICPTTVDTAFRDNWRKQLKPTTPSATPPASGVTPSPTLTAAKPGAKRSVFKRMTDGKSEVTLEQSVEAIWRQFEIAANTSGGGISYVPLSGFWGDLAHKLVRIWGYSRTRILDLADSKL